MVYVYKSFSYEDTKINIDDEITKLSDEWKVYSVCVDHNSQIYMVFCKKWEDEEDWDDKDNEDDEDDDEDWDDEDNDDNDEEENKTDYFLLVLITITICMMVFSSFCYMTNSIPGEVFSDIVQMFNSRTCASTET